ncbi:MAG: hypothetical protein AAF135_06670 [Bacteroidota bacterium]
MKYCTYLWILLILSSCTSPMFEDFSDPLPKLTIYDLEEVPLDSTRIEIKILSEGASQALQVGFLYKENFVPSVTDNLETILRDRRDTITTIQKTYLNREGFLEPGKTYFIRAYAENSFGVGFSEPVEYTVGGQVNIPPPCGFGSNTLIGDQVAYSVRYVEEFQTSSIFQYTLGAGGRQLWRFLFKQRPAVGQYQTVFGPPDVDLNNQVYVDVRLNSQSSTPAARALPGKTVYVHRLLSGEVRISFCDLEFPDAFTDPVRGSFTPE